jgi:hypothetical protein
MTPVFPTVPRAPIPLHHYVAAAAATNTKSAPLFCITPRDFCCADTYQKNKQSKTSKNLETHSHVFEFHIYFAFF